MKMKAAISRRKVHKKVQKMLLNFDKIEEKVIPQFRGGEKETIARMFTDPLIKIMRGKLAPVESIGLHTHETNREVIYILEGEGKVLYDGAYESVAAGSCHYCPKGHEHSLINDSKADLIFFAVVPEHGEN